MIPRALNAPLSWIGLMRVSEHERIVAVLEDILDETRAAESTALDQFRRADAKLKDAEFNNEQQAKVIAQLDADVGELRPDALLWRAARLKRRGNK